MRAPAAAIAWEFRTRHRWGLRSLTAAFGVMAAAKVAILASGQTVTLGSAAAALGATVVGDDALTLDEIFVSHVGAALGAGR